MGYVDAHCHLGSRYFDDDRNEMTGRMEEAGVDRAIMICCSRHDLDHCLKLREEFPGFKLAWGIHPQDLEDEHDDERLVRFEKILKEAQADMIGEIGLDYYSHPHTKEYQIRFFEKQLEMAVRYDLPIDVHMRKASNDTLQILKKYLVRGIIHSFSGSVEMARLFLKEGFYISFGASILFKGARRPAQVIADMPLDRLLIETDAPYQSPVIDHRHEPADVIRIYEAIAQVKQISIEELQKITADNFDRVFFKA